MFEICVGLRLCFLKTANNTPTGDPPEREVCVGCGGREISVGGHHLEMRVRSNHFISVDKIFSFMHVLRP